MKLRCTARRTNGETCGNWAMHGGRVCHAHGGKAPAVRLAAAARLAEVRLNRAIADNAKQRQAKRKALEPWADELGPSYMWDWHSPSELRRIAAEMRRNAAQLIQLASSTDPGRPGPCTDS